MRLKILIARTIRISRKIRRPGKQLRRSKTPPPWPR
jgi:hypothetical protein